MIMGKTRSLFTTSFEEASWLADLENVPCSTHLPVNAFFGGVNDVVQQQVSSCYTSTLRGGHIRLLRIGVDASTSYVHCTTRIFPLHRRPDYTALSYAWGPPRAFDSRCRILLDGRERMLRRNLWTFLQEASRRRPGWLWIDALSIEQCCAEERSHQVGIMSDIFANAKRVVVWLGRAYNDSDDAMEALSRPTKPRPHSNSETPTTKAINALFNRPYWTRLWVFQELKSAKKLTVMCGNSLLSWTLLETYLHNLSMGHLSAVLFNSPAAQMILLRTRTVGTSLWHLLIATQHLCCTDPRDRVYALLSAATIGHEGITADYTISASDLIYHVCKINPRISSNEANARLWEIEDVFRARSGISILGMPLSSHGQVASRPPIYIDELLDFTGDSSSIGVIDSVPFSEKFLGWRKAT